LTGDSVTQLIEQLGALRHGVFDGRPVELGNPAYEWDEIRDVGIVRQGLVLLMTNIRNGPTKPIGTGFIIKRFDKTAIVVTATHNLMAIKDIQSRPAKHHPSALAEFLHSDQTLNLIRPNIYALAFREDKIKNCQVLWAVSEERSDIAILCLDCRDEPEFFDGEFLLSDRNPKIGDMVGILGFGEITETEESWTSADPNYYQMTTRVVLRVGKVTESHPSGHLLCRGQCVSTNIPVFPGMSGGPAIHFTPAGTSMEVFGLICSDSAFEGASSKNDRSVSGRSTVALLDRQVVLDSSGSRSVQIRMEQALVHSTPQV
jgi:hypothetical protein